jgi:hypothetical protein
MLIDGFELCVKDGDALGSELGIMLGTGGI